MPSKRKAFINALFIITTLYRYFGENYGGSVSFREWNCL